MFVFVVMMVVTRKEGLKWDHCIAFPKIKVRANILDICGI
jgi:hypothetical protein